MSESELMNQYHVSSMTAKNALITGNIETATITYNALNQLSLLSKVEMITFDEIGLPDVHFIKQNYEEMGRHVVHSLISQINGKSVVKHIVVPVQFHLKS